MVDLIIPQKQEGGIITVHYSQEVNCAERQVSEFFDPKEKHLAHTAALTKKCHNKPEPEKAGKWSNPL